jgi:hypothetical protein
MELRPWYDIYRDRLNERYYNHIKSKYKFLIDAIVSMASNRYPVIEIGAGMGNVTKAVMERSRGLDYILMDICPDMMSLAMRNVGPGRNIHYVLNDINDQLFDRMYIGTIHSHGVLEHFTDDQINLIFDHFKGNHAHFVPGCKYEKPSRGDERLLSVDEWLDILPEYATVTSYNDGYDYLIQFSNWD